MSKNTKWMLGIVIPLIGAFAVAYYSNFLSSKKEPPETYTGFKFGEKESLSAKRDMYVSGRDTVTKNFLQGIDERDLKTYLGKLKAISRDGRILEVNNWYESRDIDLNLKEALITVILRIDAELKTSQATIKKLKSEGNRELAKLLERLNKAFKKSLDELEREETKILQELEKKTAEKKIEVYLNTAEKYESALQYRSALRRYQNALSLQKKHFGKDCKKISSILNKLGLIYLDLADYNNAIGQFEKALACDLSTFGPGHPKVATRWNSLGLAWNSLGDYQKAIDYFEKALIIFEKKLGPDHPNSKIVRNKLKRIIVKK